MKTISLVTTSLTEKALESTVKDFEVVHDRLKTVMIKSEFHNSQRQKKKEDFLKTYSILRNYIDSDKPVIAYSTFCEGKDVEQAIELTKEAVVKRTLFILKGADKLRTALQKSLFKHKT